jgi:flagellar basal-body rod protein FlgG
VNQTGQVFAKLDTEVNPRQIVSSTSPTSPTRRASSRWAAICTARRRRPARPVVGLPGDSGYGKINQQYLEASNVDPVKEITELISAQRAY